jgi:hypothetical protein
MQTHYSEDIRNSLIDRTQCIWCGAIGMHNCRCKKGDVQNKGMFTKLEPDGKVNVIKPSYYKAIIKGVEIDVIDIINAFGLSFCLGNALKYILRAGKKDDRAQDLKKAVESINREL